MVGNIWDDIPIAPPKESIGYPTQKPLALLRRIIEASTEKGDLVLDPFCGSATTCVAADLLERRWMGMDISKDAGEAIERRLNRDLGPFSRLEWELATSP